MDDIGDESSDVTSLHFILGGMMFFETQNELLANGIPVHQPPYTTTGNVNCKIHLQRIKTSDDTHDDKIHESSFILPAFYFPLP